MSPYDHFNKRCITYLESNDDSQVADQKLNEYNLILIHSIIDYANSTKHKIRPASTFIKDLNNHDLFQLLLTFINDRRQKSFDGAIDNINELLLEYINEYIYFEYINENTYLECQIHRLISDDLPTKYAIPHTHNVIMFIAALLEEAIYRFKQTPKVFFDPINKLHSDLRHHYQIAKSNYNTDKLFQSLTYMNPRNNISKAIDWQSKFQYCLYIVTALVQMRIYNTQSKYYYSSCTRFARTEYSYNASSSTGSNAKSQTAEYIRAKNTTTHTENQQITEGKKRIRIEDTEREKNKRIKDNDALKNGISAQITEKHIKEPRALTISIAAVNEHPFTVKEEIIDQPAHLHKKKIKKRIGTITRKKKVGLKRKSKSTRMNYHIGINDETPLNRPLLGKSKNVIDDPYMSVNDEIHIDISSLIGDNTLTKRD